MKKETVQEDKRKGKSSQKQKKKMHTGERKRRQQEDIREAIAKQLNNLNVAQNGDKQKNKEA